MTDTFDPASAKSNARALQERLGRSGHQVKLSLCYELIALSHGFPNWNALTSRIAGSGPAPTDAGSLSDLVEAARVEGVSVRALFTAYESSAPESLDGEASRKALGTSGKETAVLVPLEEPNGWTDHFVALVTGREEGMEKVETWNRRRWQWQWCSRQHEHCFPDFHPLQNETCAKLEAWARDIVSRCGGKDAPRTVAALHQAMCGRLEAMWISHLASHAPETLALARATGIWDAELMPYLPETDPISAARKAGRYAWIYSDAYWPEEWGNSEPETDGFALAGKWYATMRERQSDPHHPYLRERLLPVPPEGQPTMDATARARASTTELHDETLALDAILESVPGLVTSEVGLFGYFHYLLPFMGMARKLGKQDLDGFAASAARLDAVMEYGWTVHASEAFLDAMDERERFSLYEAAGNLERARLICQSALPLMAQEIGVPRTLDHLASVCRIPRLSRGSEVQGLPETSLARKCILTVLAERGIIAEREAVRMA